MLDLFALMVLLVLTIAALSLLIVLAMAPGRIAKSRNHPQADAISVCGWMGILTGGILLPLAFIWSYYRPTNQSLPTELPAAEKE